MVTATDKGYVEISYPGRKPSSEEMQTQKRSPLTRKGYEEIVQPSAVFKPIQINVS